MTKRQYKDRREDGFIFLGYYKRAGRTFEKWMSPEAFLRRRKGIVSRNRKLRKTNEGRAHQAKLEREYKARNPHKRAKHNRRRQGLLMNECGANDAFIRQFYLTRDRLCKCTGLDWHVDHVIALARGGAHHESNLQVIPATINLRKNSRS